MDYSNIFLDGILCDVDVSFWSGAKALTPEDLGLKESEVAEAFRLGRKMLVPDEVIREFRHVESRARRVVEVNSFPFPIGNARFIPKRKFADVLKELETLQEQYTNLACKLVSEYDELREQMIPIYRQAAEHAFDMQTPTGVTEFSMEDRETQKQEYIEKFLLRIAAYYPPVESLMGKFKLTWNLYNIAAPNMDSVDGHAILESEEKRQIAKVEYQKAIQDKMNSFIGDVVGTLRQETLEITNRILTNMKEGKVVKGNTFNSLQTFIQRFKDLNFVGDTQVESLLDSLKKELLDAYPGEVLKDNVELQGELKRRLNELADVASNMTDVNSVTGEYHRKIEWAAKEVE